MYQINRSYEVLPRAAHLGGGWNLVLLDNGEEAGGGVFPIPKEDPQAGMDWWNSIPVEERSFWLIKAASAVPADARHAFLLDEAYNEAVQEGEDWASARG